VTKDVSDFQRPASAQAVTQNVLFTPYLCAPAQAGLQTDLRALRHWPESCRSWRQRPRVDPQTCLRQDDCPHQRSVLKPLCHRSAARPAQTCRPSLINIVSVPLRALQTARTSDNAALYVGNWNYCWSWKREEVYHHQTPCLQDLSSLFSFQKRARSRNPERSRGISLVPGGGIEPPQSFASAAAARNKK